MKKIIAIGLMCIFALAFTVTRAADTSPDFQKLSIEKASIQASPVLMAISLEAPAATIVIVSYQRSNSLALEPAEIFKEKSVSHSPATECPEGISTIQAATHYAPGWPHEANLKSNLTESHSYLFSPALTIPYPPGLS